MSRELQSDIDSTIEELVETSRLLKEAKVKRYFCEEVEALEKTQESLLARLIHRQSLIDADSKQQKLASIRKEMIEKKVIEYAKASPKPAQKPARVRRARSKS
jgi:hypothetical protein